MNTFTNMIVSILLSAIQQKYNNDYSDVPAIKFYWHNCSYLFFSCVNWHRLFPNQSIDFLKMLDLKLIPNYLYSFYKEEQTVLDTILAKALSLFDSSNLDVNELRQSFFAYELDLTGDSISLFFDKVNRDNTGSYYTPRLMAEEVLKKAFDGVSFSERDSYKIADFSCGGGDFLLATIDYLEKNRGISADVSVTWLYGFDVDPIALQICVVSLLQRSNKEKWDQTISHFVFGNPLIVNDSIVDEKEKNYLYSIGRFYSLHMGIPSAYFGGSFDAVVGNPPWEKIRFEERKFFRGISNAISSIPQKSARDSAVDDLKKSWPSVYCWRTALYQDYMLMNSAKYKHTVISDSISGELNTYALFTELGYNMLSDSGILALIVKSTLVTAPVHRKLWLKFLMGHSVKGIYLFENHKKIFAIDSRERFIVFVASKEENERFEFATGLSEPKMINHSSTISLTVGDLTAINPITITIPNVRKNEEIAFLQDAHKRFRLFSEVYPNCHFGRLIHLTAQSAFIDKKQSNNNVPIYEGKFIEQYDARFASFKGIPDSWKYASKASANRILDTPEYKDKELPECRYFVHKDLWDRYLLKYNEPFSLCWRSLTSPTNNRTMIAMILPTCPTCQSIQLLQTPNPEDLILILALFNSIPFDYLVRIKMPGLDLTQSVIRQIPVPSDDDYKELLKLNDLTADLKRHILSYAVFLLQEEYRLESLIAQIKEHVYTIQGIDRQEAKKMIDLLFKKAYHLSDSNYKEILSTFPKY